MSKCLIASILAGVSFFMIAKENSTPDFLKDVPAERSIKFGPEILTIKDSNKYVKPDSDSAVGKSLGSPAESENRKHGLKVKPYSGMFSSTVSIYNWNTKKQGRSFTLRKFPADEKFHWYKLWDYEFQPGRTTMLMWWWQMQGNLSSVYKKNGNNSYTVYASLKFTGPSYVPNSKKPDGVFVDQIILVQKVDK